MMATTVLPKPEVKVPSFNEVSRHNIIGLQTQIRSTLDKAHHVAIDCEFTGLGSTKNTRATNIEERYAALVDVASNHAMVSFGLSVFEATDPAPRIPDSQKTSVEYAYKVHNFNFLMLKSTMFSVSPDSAIFLVDNGFDFNKQYRDGIFFTAGNDPIVEENGHPPAHADTNQIMRNIFLHIITRNVPIVVHNGLLDLLFIYHSLYAELPKTLEVFVADLSDMFPAGIYDTKYVSDYVTKEKASFLAYLFRKYEREQAAAKIEGKSAHVTCAIEDRMSVVEEKWRPPPSGKRKKKMYPETGKPFCEQYAAHGYCNRGRYCTKSHDLDLILDYELGVISPTSKKRRHSDSPGLGPDAEAPSQNGITDSAPKTPAAITGAKSMTACKNQQVAFTSSDTNTPTSAPTPTSFPSSTPQPPAVTPDGTLFEKYHSACFDAYMTGFIFARQILTHTPPPANKMELANKLYLMGKSMPLLVQKSAFAKLSPAHLAKKDKVLLAQCEPRGRAVVEGGVAGAL